jgi:hypothetical protein
LYRDRTIAQSALYLDSKNTRHTRLAPGQCPGLTGQLTGRLLRRVTQTTTTAVPLALINFRDNQIIGIDAVTTTYRNHDIIEFNDCRFDPLIKTK